MKVRNDDRLSAEMTRDGLDAVLAFSMENVFYLSGALFALQDNIRERLSVAAFVPDGSDFLLCATNETSGIADKTHVGRLAGYVEFERSPIQALAGLLADLGYSEARIGVEKRYLMAACYEELAARLPKAHLVPADRVLEVSRAVKLPEHVAVIETASRATERAVASALAGARPGESERDLALAIITSLYRAGAQVVRHAIVTVGDNARHAHPYPSATKTLDAGDIIRIDVGGLFDGYGTDIARMAVVGEPAPEQAARYAKVRACVAEVGHNLRPGMTAGDVYRRVVGFYERAGIPGYKRDHVGHSLSVLGGHDNPMLHDGNTMPLEEGMVIALEPILRDERGRRYTVEDTFVIERDGGRLLTDETDTRTMAVIA